MITPLHKKPLKKKLHGQRNKWNSLYFLIIKLNGTFDQNCKNGISFNKKSKPRLFENALGHLLIFPLLFYMFELCF